MDPSARIGTTLKGKWRIDRLLGTGGFATVYAATHRAGKRVAVKVLHTALGASEEVRRRFMREAYAANAVEHPAVVGVSDDDVTDDGAPFLVMDLLEGETAEARRKRSGGRLSAEEVMALVEEALDGLAAAHEKGIVHRDLKPENIFLTSDGRVKILDFGIARFREPGDESTSTQTGLTMGSPAFMAPEQARGRWSEVDARTDVYAIGATMFVLLTGQLVHGKRNLNEALIEAATKPAPRLTTVATDAPEAVAAIVDRALAFEREARWPDAAAMREAVRAARGSAASATRTVPLGAVPAALAGSAITTGRPSGVDLNRSYSSLSDAPAAVTAPLPSASAPPRTELSPPGALPSGGAAPSGTGSAPSTAAPITRSSPGMPARAPGKGAWIVAGAALSIVTVVGILLVVLLRREPSEALGGPVPAESASSTGPLPQASSTDAPTSLPGVVAPPTADPAPSSPPVGSAAPSDSSSGQGGSSPPKSSAPSSSDPAKSGTAPPPSRPTATQTVTKPPATAAPPAPSGDPRLARKRK